MNMPKSRDIHAKISSPKAILLNFGFVSVKVLNRYEYSFPESKNVRKGLGEIMGGQVLELESDRLIKKGTDDMAALTRKLMDEGRLDDLRRCTEDSAYRKKLLNEMQGIL
ncbi:hypothetical protein [Jingyaoa shaoxingensis]|uniref:LAGLIDADG homing endonuclease n=1 Tax=Jingyaoa shaoxingensis TaxID=2763671 RepID=A0ABR7N8S2_9FIRM|nr:hypothetical protein [Jingyaoa shaoxingensis]MBC8572729.1 hypothetical protein [Jingyaoa shaoxingensis]